MFCRRPSSVWSGFRASWRPSQHIHAKCQATKCHGKQRAPRPCNITRVQKTYQNTPATFTNLHQYSISHPGQYFTVWPLVCVMLAHKSESQASHHMPIPPSSPARNSPRADPTAPVTCDTPDRPSFLPTGARFLPAPRLNGQIGQRSLTSSASIMPAASLESPILS